MRLWIFIFLYSIGLAKGSDFSETSGDPRPLSSIPADLASPWTTEARPWLLGGAGATALIWILKTRVDDPVQKDVSEGRPLGKFSKWGDYGGRFYSNALYSIGMLGYGLVKSDSLALDRSLLMFKASIYAVTLSSGLKVAVGESRPNNTNDHQSFPSAHATSAFAFASFVAAEHDLPWGLASYGLAILTGFSRINDNRHYLHDVVAGATIGTVYGLGVSQYRSRVRVERKSLDSSINWQAVPVFSSDAKGVALIGEF